MLRCLDAGLFYLINKNFSNPVFDFLMPWITLAGAGGFIFTLALILIIFKSRPKKTAGLLLLAGLTVSYNIVHFLKELIARPRPFMILENVNLLEKADGFSFPSNHTVTAFMAAFIISACFRKLSPVFYLSAALVGFSRVYMGVHFPLDVAAGALVGLTLGYLLVKITESIGINFKEEL